MPAYNFKKEFADDVEARIKRQTIRQKRKRRTKPGETLYLYTGMRTKQCRSLGVERCLDVRDIEITELEYVVNGQNIKREAIIIGNNTMMVESVAGNRFARLDGFDGSAQMIEWFKKQYGLPFNGVVIRW